MMSELIYVTGGARSGKSAFALEKAKELGGEDVTFIATAERSDDEMKARIERHRLERPMAWKTVESPRNVVAALYSVKHKVILLDCLSLLVSNLLLADLDEAAILERVQALLIATQDRTLIVVSNEVGLGMVPDNVLGRKYIDALGRSNQLVAKAASSAYLMVSGLAKRLK